MFLAISDLYIQAGVKQMALQRVYCFAPEDIQPAAFSRRVMAARRHSSVTEKCNNLSCQGGWMSYLLIRQSLG